MHVTLAALVVYVAVISGASAVDADGRIGAIGLRHRGKGCAIIDIVVAGDNKLGPRSPGRCAHRAALLAAALVGR